MQVGRLVSTDVGRHRRAGEQQAGEVKHGVRPVSPPGNESVELAEGLSCPYVEAAFGRITRGKLNNDERRRHEEEERCNRPNSERRGPGICGGSDPARTEDGRDVEKQHVPEVQLPAQLGLNFSAGGGGQNEGSSCKARKVNRKAARRPKNKGTRMASL